MGWIVLLYQQNKCVGRTAGPIRKTYRPGNLNSRSCLSQVFALLMTGFLSNITDEIHRNFPDNFVPWFVNWAIFFYSIFLFSPEKTKIKIYNKRFSTRNFKIPDFFLIYQKFQVFPWFPWSGRNPAMSYRCHSKLRPRRLGLLSPFGTSRPFES